MQLALAAMDRISDILALDTHMTLVSPQKKKTKQGILEFQHVSFHYTDEKKFILHDANFVLESGKTYALVGPTGGGKTTTASLMARLYDPTDGTILLNGQDIRSYDHDVRAQKIGFILQEPFVFSGTIQENILYGNHEYKDFSEKQLIQLLKKHDLMELLDRFPQGLRTHLSPELDTISL
jgi:ATP-binding cassette subfamily B protein